MLQNRIKQAIRNVPDFPKSGIMFKDITPILMDYQLSVDIAEHMVAEMHDWNIDAVVGVESRGFLFGMMVATGLCIPFIPVRKAGKLPYKTVSHAYELEYGQAEVEMHVDAVKPGMNVLVHDDLLATGGTAGAAAELIQKQGGKVAGFSFLVGLSFLSGTEPLKKYSEQLLTLVEY
jgi:adenine phosphoribosyltransferase